MALLVIILLIGSVSATGTIYTDNNFNQDNYYGNNTTVENNTTDELNQTNYTKTNYESSTYQNNKTYKDDSYSYENTTKNNSKINETKNVEVQKDNSNKTKKTTYNVTSNNNSQASDTNYKNSTYNNSDKHAAGEPTSSNSNNGDLQKSYDKSKENTTKTDTNAPAVVKVNEERNNLGEKTTFEAIISTVDGSIVDHGKTAFKINGHTVGYANISNGTARFNYVIPEDWKNPTYLLQVVYGGNYKSSRGEGSNSIAINDNIDSSDSQNIETSTTSKDVQTSNADDTTVTNVDTNNDKSSESTTNSTDNSSDSTNKNENVSDSTNNVSGNVSDENNHDNDSLSEQDDKKDTSKSKSSDTTGYLSASANCEVGDSQISGLASNLVSSQSSTYNNAEKLYDYVRDNIDYSYYYDTQKGAVGTLNAGYGNCVDQSHLLISLLRTAEIPARYCHSTCSFRSGLTVGHVWAEALVNDTWYSCDTTSSSNSFGNIVNWYQNTGVTNYASLPF